MDTLRGQFDAYTEGEPDSFEDEVEREVPPASIGTDERRMQVRAYNHWASLLQSRNFPAIEDLEPDNLGDFGPYSVLLDFTNGIDNPGISYLGDKLAIECDATVGEMATLSDVPSRSLLSRITDHYMQILANQAPIGFEAEFVNQRGKTILYRGILLPFSSDDDTIDFIYGVINWKELADQHAADELLLEIDQALEAKPPRAPLLDADEALTDWADGPGSVAEEDESSAGEFGLPQPSFGVFGEASDEALEPVGYGPFDTDEDTFELDDASIVEDDLAEEEDRSGGFASLVPGELDIAAGPLRKKPIVIDATAEPLDLAALDFATDAEPIIDLPELAPDDMGLGDWLAAAREMAASARTSEDRTRSALYEAIGRAYDFSVAAQKAPEEFDELLADSGLSVQDRAPMTPVVKLVFGADYDKTRLTEYAAALSHAHRLQLPQGSLGGFLAQADGGLKGVVKAERRLRREETGKPIEAADAPRYALAKKLRELQPQDFAAISPEGSEFALVMIRRTGDGEVVMLGEVPDDVTLLERAARRMVG